MIDYPSIGYDYTQVLGRMCVVSEKLDGHNVRAELCKSRFKLGARRRLVGTDDDDAVFAAGATVFFEMYADKVAAALSDARLRRAVVYAELYGSRTHMVRVDHGTQMDWAFLDVLDMERRQFLEPSEALKVLEGGGLPVPRYTVESVDMDIVNAVRGDRTPNREGVVFKPKRVRKPSLSLPYAKAKTAWFMDLFNDP